MLDISGLPLGTFDGASYDEAAIELAAGDLFIFYTDGLVEAGSGREEYGEERLREAIVAHADLGAPALGDRLLSELDRFLGPQTPADDISLIVVKVL
jgi:sigma-B regulation protein RsbU (phosphoserine phosphatase)